MSLEIDADARYRVTLVIPDHPDPFPTWQMESTCKFPNVTARQSMEVRQISMVLGKHAGQIDPEKGIVGQPATPIQNGPRTITGSWSFSTDLQ
jgi:hypothetical protein